jgi:hypothetical protein
MTILDQNYFQFHGKTYIQSQGLAMEAPTSSVLSEIYLQHLENTEICNLLIKHNIEGYFRYVDDFPIIYNENNLLDYFDKLNPKLVFTLEREKDKKSTSSI